MDQGNGTIEKGRTVMARKRNRQQQQEQPSEPRRTDFVAPGCPACESIREPGTNYSRVYSTSRTTQAVYRYCKCGYCGHTWKVVTTP